MSKVNTVSYLNPFDNLLKNTAKENKDITIQASTLSKQDSLNLTSRKPKDITESTEFKTVFPNFDSLDKYKQAKVLQKVNLYLAKYPDFLTKLSKIDNPKFGVGFQFFFVPGKDDSKFKSSTEVIGKAMGDTASGIVFGGSGGVLENSVLKTPVAKISQSVVNNGVLGHKFDNTKINLDVGGMFTSSSEDTFAHEMGHVVNSYFMSNNERLELWSIYANAKDSGKFPTEYSKTNNMEFFAEGMEAYLMQDYSGKFIERDELKEKSPELYNFVAKEIDPNVKKTETQSTLKSVGIISEYVADGAYSKGKDFVGTTYNKTKKLLGL